MQVMKWAADLLFRTGFIISVALFESLLLSSTRFFPPFSYDSAPLSASLLSDWSEVHRMTPADLESLQQELQLGSPMILSDSIPSDA